MSHPSVAAFTAAHLIEADQDYRTLALNRPYCEWCAVHGFDPIGYPPFAKALDSEVPTAFIHGRKFVVGMRLRDDWKFATPS